MTNVENISIGMIGQDPEYIKAFAGATCVLYRGIRIVAVPDIDEQRGAELCGADGTFAKPAGTDIASFAEYTDTDNASFVNPAICGTDLAPTGDDTAHDEEPNALPYISLKEEIDVYLIDDRMVEMLPREILARAVILFDAASAHPPKTMRAADKYGTCSQIMSAVLACFAESSGRPAPLIETGRGSNGPRLLSFFSFTGGAGTSSIALSVARELSRYRDQSTLYLSLEPFVAPTGTLETTAQNISELPGLREYLFCFLRRESDITTKTAQDAKFLNDAKFANDATPLTRLRMAATQSDEYGVVRFRKDEGLNPLVTFRFPELKRFIESFAGANFENIVLDWGVRADQVFRDFLGLSTQLIFVGRARAAAGMPRRAKVLRFAQDDSGGSSDDSGSSRDASGGIADMRNAWRTKNIAALGIDTGRLISVCNMDDEYEDNDPEFTDESRRLERPGGRVLSVPTDYVSFQNADGNFDPKLSGTFGLAIKKLVDMII